MPFIDKEHHSVTLDERLYRKVISIIRDEAQWSKYVVIVKNNDGTRTITIKDALYSKLVKIVLASL